MGRKTFIPGFHALLVASLGTVYIAGNRLWWMVVQQSICCLQVVLFPKNKPELSKIEVLWPKYPKLCLRKDCKKLS